jgi:poly(3-hydroxybutyrate) depolymerase
MWIGRARLHRLALVFLVAAALLSCATRRDNADAVARRGRLQARVVATERFDLFTYRPAALVAGAPLVVYIEGDGLAWITRTRISDDPTPVRPVALELAVQDRRANVVYLARPCQYVTGHQRRNCQPAYWDTAGYADEVIQAIAELVGRLKAEAGSERVHYLGYSGGGAVATLVADRRHDAATLTTIAGVLDHAAWTKRLGLEPLRYSLNPIDAADRLATTRQLHFVGGRDEVVPESVAVSFVSRYGPDGNRLIKIVPDFDHECCWSDQWPTLLTHAPSLASGP